MRLQSQDYIAANQIQIELSKLIPGDPIMKEFAALLPEKAADQEDVMRNNGDEEEYGDEYYDEEEDGDAEEPEEEVEEAEAIPETTDKTTFAATAIEDEKKDEDDEDDESDSDYDEEGNYIWGAENDDWEFYYKEDKEAYEKG